MIPGAETAAPAPMSPVLSWSGGKDSSLALWRMRALGWPVRALLTTITEGYDRISMHGVRELLLERQAAASGLPLVRVRIPKECHNRTYEERMGAAVQRLIREGVDAFAFGDLFLEDIRRYREEHLAGSGARALFPLFGADTRALAERFIDLGFQAILVTVDPRRLDPSFAGRPFDRRLLSDLPEDVDPCGENGEFHTFVWDGPVFQRPIPVRTGDHVLRDGFAFCDLEPVD